jgi:hypothetical protein
MIMLRGAWNSATHGTTHNGKQEMNTALLTAGTSMQAASAGHAFNHAGR